MTRLGADVAGRAEAAVGDVQHPHAVVAGGVRVGDRPRPVGRPVVDDDDLEVDALLGEQAVQRLGEPALHVVDRYDDATPAAAPTARPSHGQTSRSEASDAAAG